MANPDPSSSGGRPFAFIAVIILAVVVGLVWYKRYRPGRPAPTRVAEGPIYLQTDPRWASDTLGGSGETLSEAGCVVCCVAMALDALGVDLHPGQLNARLKGIDGYSREGWVRWNAVAQVAGGKVGFQIPQEASRSAIDGALGEGRQVIAKAALPAGRSHWVLIVGKDADDYWIKDPLGNGTTLERLSKYPGDPQAIRILRAIGTGGGG